MGKDKAIVVGAGIVGMAVARALAKKGFKVSVYERDERAVGASIRNFGMIWPIGQPKGKLFNRAIRTREIWGSICDEAGIWYNPSGSLHLLYNKKELAVAEEFVSENKKERECQMLLPYEALNLSPAANPNGLLGALWSGSEMIVESREAIDQVRAYLEEKLNISFHFGKAVTQIKPGTIYLDDKKKEADIIVVCSGSDFETLYPKVYQKSKITKCKVQMMRTVPQPDNWNIGPSLCGGLTLMHYGAFSEMPSLPALKKYYLKEYPEQIEWGVHVLVSQSPYMEITLGDSHEYGKVFDPFNKNSINELVIKYLSTFAVIKDLSIAQTWHGIYSKLPGETEFIATPEKDVHIINGLSGSGMTLSFGLAEEWVGKVC